MGSLLRVVGFPIASVSGQLRVSAAFSARVHDGAEYFSGADRYRRAMLEPIHQ
jgi:hypothetical protein